MSAVWIFGAFATLAVEIGALALAFAAASVGLDRLFCMLKGKR